jgi:predicted lactoylglutathione lyase
MLTNINPKLPMRDINVTKAFYIDKLGFNLFGTTEYADYLMLEKDQIQIHFFYLKN